MLKELIRQIDVRDGEIDLDEVRENADRIRIECRSFQVFFKRAWKILEPETKLVWNWHLTAMCQHIEAIVSGKLYPRLITNVPPGSSKSLLISVMFNAWLWGPMGMPSKRVVSTSYSMNIVERDILKFRNLIESEWYQQLWPIRLEQARGDKIENSKRGVREGASFGSLTGLRGDFLIVDDPHSVKLAESENERDKAIRLFLEGGQNRLNDQSKSAIIVVMQRLHENDLTGAILARDTGYIHLCLPMEFEVDRRCITPIFEDPRTYEGELLDPIRMPESAIAELKHENDYFWAGQYQQRPAPREGGMFKCDNMQVVPTVPEGAVYRRGWDIAGSARKRAAFTAGTLLAYANGIVYIVDVKRGQKEIDEAEQLIIATAHADHERYGIVVEQSLPQDPGQSGKSQKFHLANQLAGTNFRFSPESGSKEDRAIPFASMVNSGMVRLVNGDWNAALLNEMRNFPNSMYKDQVDALSRAYSEIIKVMKVNMNDTIGAPIYS